MARLQGLAPGEARRFRTGRACLDLAHTGGDGPFARFELLHAAGDVSRWLSVITGLDEIRATDKHLPAVRALRRAIWDTAHDAIAGLPPAPAGREVINQAAAHEPPIPQLGPGGRPAVGQPVTVPQVLSLLARDAVELFSGPLATRIRECAADDCALLYVDQSRTGNRAWCSMQRCGTRAKVRAHRARPAAQAQS